jgi:hypothetical protein
MHKELQRRRLQGTVERTLKVFQSRTITLTLVVRISHLQIGQAGANGNISQALAMLVTRVYNICKTGEEKIVQDLLNFLGCTLTGDISCRIFSRGRPGLSPVLQGCILYVIPKCKLPIYYPANFLRVALTQKKTLLTFELRHSGSLACGAKALRSGFHHYMCNVNVTSREYPVFQPNVWKIPCSQYSTLLARVLEYAIVSTHREKHPLELLPFKLMCVRPWY